MAYANVFWIGDFADGEKEVRGWEFSLRISGAARLGKSCQGGITFEGYFCRKSPGISPGFRRPPAARSAIFIIIEHNYKPAAGADFFLGHTTPQFLVIFQGGITFEGDFCRKSPGISTGFRL